MRRFVLFLLISALPACALQQDFIEVRHAPTVAPAQIQEAQAISVAIEARDDRTTNRDRVSVKKNGYGMEMASIVATNDVVRELGGVVGTTLERMGFQTSQPRDGTVTVDVHRVWNDFKIGFWSGQAVSEVSVLITVRDRAGRVVFTRLFGVENTVPGVMIASGENARLSLVQAFDRLGQQVATDRELTAALLALGSVPAGSVRNPPSANPPPRQIIPRGGVPLS